ncbi:MAG: Uma2 family endonuclease [Epsilonproteobacteria bacterium]|nr:Uma2 family endonuclease [Campylobacterota bacterium]
MPPLAQTIEYYTYEDYINWDGDWELIDGVAYAMAPAPMRKHQSLATEIMYNLREQLEECTQCEVLGEIDYKISNDTVLKPDIVLTCGETNESYLTKAPEIVVEIISKSTAKRDEKYKFQIYEEEKVKYYILVYPDDLKAKIYKLKGSDYDKEGDFLQESYDFDETTCKVSLDFERVFRRFR